MAQLAKHDCTICSQKMKAKMSEQDLTDGSADTHCCLSTPPTYCNPFKGGTAWPRMVPRKLRSRWMRWGSPRCSSDTETAGSPPARSCTRSSPYLGWWGRVGTRDLTTIGTDLHGSKPLNWPPLHTQNENPAPALGNSKLNKIHNEIQAPRKSMEAVLSIQGQRRFI